MDTHTADIKVLGGLPITVKAWIAPAEPDVGIAEPYVEDVVITHVAGRACKKTPHWLQHRIEDRKEYVRLCENVMADFNGELGLRW